MSDVAGRKTAAAHAGRRSQPHVAYFVPIAPWRTLISCSAVRVAQQPFRKARVPFLRAKAVSKPDTFSPLMPASLKVPPRGSRENEELRW